VGALAVIATANEGSLGLFDLLASASLRPYIPFKQKLFLQEDRVNAHIVSPPVPLEEYNGVLCRFQRNSLLFEIPVYSLRYCTIVRSQNIESILRDCRIMCKPINKNNHSFYHLDRTYFFLLLV